jgi:hypothetical protein
MRAVFSACAHDHESASFRHRWSTWSMLRPFRYTGKPLAANPVQLGRSTQTWLCPRSSTCTATEALQPKPCFARAAQLPHHVPLRLSSSGRQFISPSLPAPPNAGVGSTANRILAVNPKEDDLLRKNFDEYPDRSTRGG